MLKYLFAIEPGGLSGREAASRKSIIVVLALITAAIVIRLFLANYSLWLDEYASLYFAQQPPALLWSVWMVRETNPPLFYTFLQGWIALGANSVFSLRLLPILGGSIQLLLLAIICLRWFGTRAAFFAIILAGLSAQNIFYSHLLRGYIFEVDGVLLSLLGLMTIVSAEKRPNVIGWALHIGGCLLATYCHTTMLLWSAISTIAFMAIAWPRLWIDRGELFKELVIVSILIAIGSAWWLYITYEQLMLGATNISWNKTIGPREYIRQFMGACLLTYDIYDRDKLSTNIIALLSVASSVFTWRDRPARMISITGMLSIGLFCIVGMVQPIIVQRTIFWMTIFPILLIAAGLGKLRSEMLRWGTISFVGLLLVNNLTSKKALFELQDWTTAMDTVAADPKGILLIQEIGMRNALVEACRVRYGNPTCPFRYLTVDFGADEKVTDSIARSLIPLHQVTRHLNEDDKIYALHSYDYDPFLALMVRPANAPADWTTRFFQGPVGRTQIISKVAKVAPD